MRALIRFGQLLLILAVGTAAAALWAFVLSKGPGGALGAAFDGAGGPAGEAGGPADPTGVERMGETGAEIAFADGRRVRVELPEGFRLDPAATRLDGETVSLGIRPESGRPFFVLVSLTEGLGAATLPGKLAFYERVAEQMRARGSIGARGEAVPVSEIRVDARGLFYCMQRGARMSLTGARLRRGVFVIVVLREGCGPATGADIARLDAIALGVTPERWR